MFFLRLRLEKNISLIEHPDHFNIVIQGGPTKQDKTTLLLNIQGDLPKARAPVLLKPDDYWEIQMASGFLF